MPSADRKVIHDVLTENTAVVTRSEGEDPNRRVVIAPANG
jgi:spoIIIJ-associated protein